MEEAATGCLRVAAGDAWVVISWGVRQGYKVRFLFLYKRE